MIHRVQGTQDLATLKIPAPPAHRAVEPLPNALDQTHKILVTLAERPHPFPSRTRKLSSPAPKILRGQPFGKIGRRQDFCVSGQLGLWTRPGWSSGRRRAVAAAPRAIGGYPAGMIDPLANPAALPEPVSTALAACPHLVSVDGSWHGTTPSRAHRCRLLASGRPTLDRQREHCLSRRPTHRAQRGSTLTATAGAPARAGPFVPMAPVVPRGAGPDPSHRSCGAPARGTGDDRRRRRRPGRARPGAGTAGARFVPGRRRRGVAEPGRHGGAVDSVARRRRRPRGPPRHPPRARPPRPPPRRRRDRRRTRCARATR